MVRLWLLTLISLSTYAHSQIVSPQIVRPQNEVWPSSVELFYSRIAPLKDTGSLFRARGIPTTTYSLSRVEELEEQLSLNLPRDRAPAEAAITARLKTVDPTEINDAWRNVLRAFQFNLTHLPAIVFDARYVVYGVADMPTALEQYRLYKAKSP